MNQEDVDIIDRDTLDPYFQVGHPKRWLIQFSNGHIEYADTEEEACGFQRFWRAANGLHPLTGT